MVRVNELSDSIDQLFRQTKSRMDFIIQSQLKSTGGVSAGTQSINDMLTREIEVFIDGTRRIVSAAAAASMDEITAQMIVSAGAEVGEAMQQLATAVRTRANRKQGLARIHEQVADHAREAVLQAYQTRVNTNGHPVYREGQNRLTGRMLTALQRPDIIRAQRDGIIFGNTAVLDAVAAHWRRLNFGAGERGQQRGQQPAPLLLGGQRLSGQFLRFDIGPSAAFNMPAGLFFNRGGDPVQFQYGGQHAFYPFGMAVEKLRGSGLKGAKLARLLAHPGVVGRSFPTRGIRGAHFFEAGLFVLGQELPDRYLALAKQWISEATDEVHPRGPIAAARGI